MNMSVVINTTTRQDRIMTTSTLNATTTQTNVSSEAATSNVVNIRSARKAQVKAQQDLFDYMMWTLKHDMDPHRLYDDPIEMFRAEMKKTLSVA